MDGTTQAAAVVSSHDPLYDPVPRSPQLLRETLAAWLDWKTAEAYSKYPSDKQYWRGVVSSLEWMLGINPLSPVYREPRDREARYPVDQAAVMDEKKNAVDEFTGRGRDPDQYTPLSPDFYEGVEHACSWALGNDRPLVLPQKQPGFRWTVPARLNSTPAAA
jgi:hypothetical protein